jgi:hypothetical protein
MRRMMLVFSAAAVVTPAAGSAQDGFEGVVAYRMTGQGLALEVTHYVRGGRVRQELAGPLGPMAMIIDAGEQTMTVLVPQQGAYMRLDMRAALEPEAEEVEPNAPPPEVQITPTGQRETIAGIECEHFELRTGDHPAVDICGAKGLGFYLAGGMGAVGGPASAAHPLSRSDAVNARLRAYFKDGLFPLKLTMQTPSGTLSMVATSVEKKELGDELFSVPVGFTEMRLPGAGGG